MRRVALLVAVVTALWGLTGSQMVALAAALQPGASAMRELTDPYYVCSGRVCVAQSGCGESQCGSDVDCGGCDPQQRSECLASGWLWDDNSCTCSQPPCNEADQLACVNAEGRWHEDGCWCEGGCFNPEWREVETITSSYEYCADCWWECEDYTVWRTMEMFCDDGRSRGMRYTTSDSGTRCYFYPEYCFIWCEV